MKRISVQAFEDRGQADGGHAILLLDGVMSIPQRSTFKLRATEPNQAGADGVVWQDSEIVALETRLGAKGIELVIGPDVAEDPGLMAGAVMELEIPEAGLRGEFMWPQITPRVRPKRRNIATVKPRRDGRPGEIMMRSDTASDDEPQGQTTGQTSSPPVNPAQTPPSQGVRPTGALMDAHLKALKNATAMPSLPITLAFNDAGRSIVPFDRKAPAAASAGPGAGKPVAAHAPAEPAQSVSIASASTQSNEAEGDDEPADDVAATDEAIELTVGEMAPPLIDPHGAHVNLSTSLVFDSNPNDPNEPKADDNPWAWRKDVTALLSTKFLAMGQPAKLGGQPGKPGEAAPQARSGIDSPVVAAIADETPGAQTIASWVRDNAEAGTSFIKRAAPQSAPSWSTYAVGLCAALAVGALGLQVAGKLPKPSSPAVSAPATTTAAPGFSVAAEASPFAAVPPAGTFAAPAVAEAASADAKPGTLFEALAVGATSPRGSGVSNVSAAKALENANASLQAQGAARDPAEGAFWLKRYVTSVIGEERNMRVVTQLGSLYAEPSGQAPDFDKARTLWEIASAAGDPVAMCFLGQLHENGLGVDLDKKAALNWYEQAKLAGGCTSVDEAITRVRN